MVFGLKHLAREPGVPVYGQRWKRFSLESHFPAPVWKSIVPGNVVVFTLMAFYCNMRRHETNLMLSFACYHY